MQNKTEPTAKLTPSLTRCGTQFRTELNAYRASLYGRCQFAEGASHQSQRREEWHEEDDCSLITCDRACLRSRASCRHWPKPQRLEHHVLKEHAHAPLG